MDPLSGKRRRTVADRVGRVLSEACGCTLARGGLRLTSLRSLRANQRLARGVAAVATHVPARVTHSIRTNLALCFPEHDERQRAHLARASLAQSLSTMLELGPTWHWK